MKSIFIEHLWTRSRGEGGMRFLHCLAIALFLGAACGAAVEGRQPKGAAAPTLEEAFRKWRTGFASDDKEVRLNALRSMLPTKDDVAYLFPKQADKLWPRLQEGHKFLEGKVDLFAKEITKGGATAKVEAIDVRTDEVRSSGSYKDLLAVIPKDVPVYDLVVSRDGFTSCSGPYLLFKDRWVWINALETFPENLEKFN